VHSSRKFYCVLDQVKVIFVILFSLFLETTLFILLIIFNYIIEIVPSYGMIFTIDLRTMIPCKHLLLENISKTIM